MKNQSENQMEDSHCHSIPAAIGQPARQALAAAGLLTLEMVAQVEESDLLALHGVGPKAVRILKAAMKDAGIAE